MKPDWKDAPEWATYLAQDKDRGWWWYEKQPVVREMLWTFTEFKHCARMARAAYPPPNEWELSLEKRP